MKYVENALVINRMILYQWKVLNTVFKKKRGSRVKAYANTRG